jgi:hypothetical protein
MSELEEVEPTGRRRHRSQRRLFGREELVLQVEFKAKHIYPLGPSVEIDRVKFWRDAKSSDLTISEATP